MLISGREPIMSLEPSVQIETPIIRSDAWWLAGGVLLSNVAGVWQPKNAASLAASYLRIAGDLGNANIDPAIVGGVAPTSWDGVGGWGSNGASCLKTGIMPNETFSMIIQFSDGSTSGDHCLGGSYEGNPVNDFGLWQITGGKSYYLNYSLLASSNYITSGTLAVAGKNAYKNGSPDGTIGAGAVSSGLEIYLFVAHKVFGIWFPFIGRIQAVAIYKTTISPTQVSAISAALVAL